MFMITGGEQPASRPIGTKHDVRRRCAPQGFVLPACYPHPCGIFLKSRARRRTIFLYAFTNPPADPYLRSYRRLRARLH
jgi:hypothetical protein